MTRLVVVGGGGHAKVVIAIIRKLEDLAVEGYVDPHDMGIVLGAPYLGNDSSLQVLVDEKGVGAAALGVGHPSDSTRRRSVAERLKSLGYSLPEVVSPNAVVSPDVSLGAGAVVMDGVVINCGSQIGECAIVNTGAVVEHDCRIGSYVHIAPGATICGGADVGAGTLVGAAAVVLPGCRIAPDSTIGAGAAVTRPCVESGVYIGVPARRVR